MRVCVFSMCHVCVFIILLYMFVCVFGLILYVPVNIFSVMSGRVFLGLARTKQRIKCVAQVHNEVHEPAISRSRVKHSTTKPLPSSFLYV